MTIDSRWDTLISGASLAAMVAAARLAEQGQRVLVLEQEEYSPYHASGRAVKVVDPGWHRPDVAPLAWAGASLRQGIPNSWRPREILHLVGDDWLASYPGMNALGIAADSGVQQLEGWEAARCFPYLKKSRSRAALALRVPAGVAGVVDAGAVYRYYRTQLYRHSGRIALGEALEEGSYGGGAWHVRTNSRELSANVIINAAGPWSDTVARRCGARRLGLVSSKRVALELTCAPDEGVPWEGGPIVVGHDKAWPFVCDIRPEGKIWVSPGWEWASTAGDAVVEASDVARAILDLDDWTALRPTGAPGRSEAWLRTSAPDQRPTVGWARETPHFMWLTGCGTSGIDCALAGASMAADWITDRSDFAETIDQYGIVPERFSPDRLGYAGIAV